ncbi:MAG: hypothetical protein OCD76_01930 [Reichenbachiella sp.]
MKKVIAVIVLVLVCGVSMAQNRVLWKDHNVILEQKIDDATGDSVYSLYAKESKYQEMYYLLTVSSGSLDQVYQDVQLMNEMCNDKKGRVEKIDGRELASRDVKSVFVIVKGDLGFALLQQQEMKKVTKVLEKKAAEIGIELASVGSDNIAK